MNTPAEPTAQLTSTNNFVRRLAVSIILSGLVLLVLLSMAFSLATSLLIGAAFCVVVVVAGATSSVIELVLEAIATVVFGVLAVIAAVVAAIFGLFN